MNQLINEHENAINERGDENAFGCFIAVGIDINGKQYGIGQQRNAADGGEQLQVVTQDVKIFAHAYGPAENPKIIDHHGKQWSENAQQDAES